MESLNFVDIFMLILLVIFVLEGYFRGFVLAVINLFRSIFGYALCFYASAKLTPIVYNGYVEGLMYDKISAKIGEIANFDGVAIDVKNTVDGLPDFLRDVVDVSKLENVTNDSAIDFVMNSVVEPVANIVIKIVIFVLVFVLFFAITGVIISLIKRLKKLDKSPLKTADRVLGGVLGFVKYGVIVFALIAVVNMIAPYSTSGDGIIAMAKSSAIYNFIGQYDLFNVILGGI